MLQMILCYGWRVKKLAYNSTLKKLRSWHLVPLLNGKYVGKKWKEWQILFSLSPKSLWMVTAAMKLKDLEEQLFGKKLSSSWKKSYDKPRQHIKKQRHHFATKVHLVKAMVFRVVMYGCESWTIKKAEHQRIDAFKLWCWRRLLRVPWPARRSNQAILKGNQS